MTAAPDPATDLHDSHPPTDPRIRYRTEVLAVGSMIPEFRESGLLVFFAEQAPQELHDIVVLHRPSVAESAPEPGDVFELDGERFTITAVGSVVAENLLRLGHASVKADGAVTAALPGDLNVEKARLPLPVPGSTMRIVAGGIAGQTSADPNEEST
jgi:PTS system glucitol/sorbitol-specific IIA component